MEQSQEQTKKVSDPNRWKPGKYRAKAVDWLTSKTKDGSPQVDILFEYQQPGEQPGSTEQRQMIWYGSFKGGARERTMETLFNLGLRGPVSTLETGRDGKALDAEKEVEIVVEHRVYNGILRAGIAWVNEIGGRGLQNKLAEGESKALFADIDQEFLATLAQKGAEVKGAPATPAQKTAPAATLSEEDIPF